MLHLCTPFPVNGTPVNQKSSLQTLEVPFNEILVYLLVHVQNHITQAAILKSFIPSYKLHELYCCAQQMDQ